MNWMQIFVAIVALVFFLYKWGMKNNEFWKRRKVSQAHPVPFLGDVAPLMLKSVHFIKYLQELYFHTTDRMLGLYLLMKPVLLIRDPELLKQILIKDADHFVNRYNFSNNTDTFLNKNLTLLRDEQWRNLRAVMSTTFTGAKMKDMFKFMSKCAEQSANNMNLQLQRQTVEKGSDFKWFLAVDANILEIDAKDYFSRYGTDVIATTAFGLEVDSFKHQNNEFYTIGTKLRNMFKSFPFFRSVFMALFPEISKKLKISFFGEEINNFFIKIVDETIAYREKNNIVRKDIIHVLMEARKGKGLEDNDESYGKGKIPDLTNADIAAQSMSFFFGGFDIMATALGFICYELAINPKIQEKLIEEINEVIEYENGVTYDGVMFKMTYLDMVVKEALRKWPPAVLTDREVSKTYVIPKSGDTDDVVLHKGDVVYVPIIALHHDPKYYPNPDEFDPERFRDEKNTIQPLTYLPFGAGLRHCIALRYAAMEIKIGMVYLLKDFIIVPTKKTGIPIKLKESNSMTLEPENGFWLGLKPRNFLV